MAEYIEREATYKLAKRIVDIIRKNEIPTCVLGQKILDLIDDIPAVDVAPVRRGRWNVGTWGWECSECAIESNNTYPVCPYCGARMDGGSDDGT